jgi:hypothetical protein
VWYHRGKNEFCIYHWVSSFHLTVWTLASSLIWGLLWSYGIIKIYLVVLLVIFQEWWFCTWKTLMPHSWSLQCLPSGKPQVLAMYFVPFGNLLKMLTWPYTDKRSWKVPLFVEHWLTMCRSPTHTRPPCLVTSDCHSAQHLIGL